MTVKKEECMLSHPVAKFVEQWFLSLPFGARLALVAMEACQLADDRTNELADLTDTLMAQFRGDVLRKLDSDDLSGLAPTELAIVAIAGEGVRQANLHFT